MHQKKPAWVNRKSSGRRCVMRSATMTPGSIYSARRSTPAPRTWGKNRYKRVGERIYRDARTNHFYERPWVNGRRTWRLLPAVNLKVAREALASRRTDAARAALGLARDPYGPQSATVGEILNAYTAAGCPDRELRPRRAQGLAAEGWRIGQLLPFWKARLAEKIDPVGDCQAYFAARRRNPARPECHGGRCVDLELATLSNALAWALRTRRAAVNALAADRPRFAGDVVVHCRDCAPRDADELHRLAAFFFAAPASEPMGWQVLLEAMTGCRTCEVLALRWDAAPGRPGYVENGWLWLARTKGGVNPFVVIHPALTQCLTALQRWRQMRFPAAPWFLPSPRSPMEALGVSTLAHGLRRACPLVVGRRMTSHGMRAYYVTARRSQGISDAQIAAEIGDSTGASIISSTYGAVPPNWRGGEKIGWLPANGPAAWDALGKEQK